MEDFGDRYGSRFTNLVDSRASGKLFEFDQVLLMPTASGYRALVEQARTEINPRIMQYLSRRWSEGAIENLSFFAMAAAVYARSVSDPSLNIDVGRAILRHVSISKKAQKGSSPKIKEAICECGSKKRSWGLLNPRSMWNHC